MRHEPRDSAPLVGTPAEPPRAWFSKPTGLEDDAYLTVTDDGRVYGRYYAADAPLLTSDGSYEVAPPSPTGYEIFHRQSVLTAEGDVLRVGAIVFGGHAANSEDDPRNIIAVVRCGDDAAGGWCSGSLVPEATQPDARLLRRSQLSGSWIPMGEAWFASRRVDPGFGMEMYALCAVTVGKAVLYRRYKNYSPMLHRLDVDKVEECEHRLRCLVRDVLDTHGPDALRHVLDELDRDYLRRRVSEIPKPPPLPEARIPSLTTARTEETR